MSQLDPEILDSTAERFKRREAERTANLRNLQAFRNGEVTLAEVDDPTRIEWRLRRALTREAYTAGGTEELTFRGSVRELNCLGFERIMGTDDLLRSSFLYAGSDAAQSVGRIAISSGEGAPRGFGTGFLIAPDAVMTNHHVLSRADDARKSRIQFGYWELPTGRLAMPLEFQLLPDRLFVASKELDYAVVAVAPRDTTGEVEARDLGWHALDTSAPGALIGERLNLLQHPRGGPQRCALRDNQLVDLLDDHFHYMSDTERGSSGSPVFNDQWEVIALHHSGVPKRDEDGNYVRVDGTRWIDGLHDIDELRFVANEGVRIERIVEDLRRRVGGLSADQGRRLEAALAATVPERPPLCDVTSRAKLVAGRIVMPTKPAPASTTAPRMVEHGGRTLTVPLRITVEDDQVTSVALSASTTLPERPLVEPTGPTNTIDGRNWYDPAVDRAARERYYFNIPAEGALFDPLSDLLRRTHRKVLSYDVARYDHLYAFVDLHEDGRLRSLYSGKSVSADELARLDREIELERTRRKQDWLMREGFVSGAELQAFEEILEYSLPFNCEHVVPQSWFSYHTPMRTDLHHLFACESGCNSFRGNLYFFDFPPELEAFREDCGQLLDRRFEPTAGKGAAARATLYFLLRYPAEIQPITDEMPSSAIDTLLCWHDKHPVSSWERHRNAAIADAQGNRNPLIDHPEWVSRIDFARGMG